MNPWAILVALAVAAGGCWYSYSAGREHQRNECEATAARERDIGQAAADRAASAAAGAIAAIKVQHRTITQEVQREVLERPVYRSSDCSHGPEQLQRINAALTGAASAAEPAGRGLVPRADAIGRPQLRGDDAEADRGGRPVP